MDSKNILWFKDVKKEDISIAGGKGANLGELTKAGFNVPNGFIISTSAYNAFVQLYELKEDINEQISRLDIGDHILLENISDELKKIIMDESIFDELVKEIHDALKQLKGNTFAVRSSATAEDLLTASFAGQQDTFLNVGKENIIDAVKRCWASLFNPRAIYYRHEKKVSHDVSMAVVVQEMIDADFAGVMFTLDPIRKRFILVEAATGLGEKVVSGSVTPSSYMLDRLNFGIREKHPNYEIDDSIITNVAKVGMKIEKHYNRPQDIEFAVKDNRIFILQSRAITTL
jgi:pyruvate, water dikinase